MSTDNGKDIGKVIDKIRKLFSLGQSPNENEAASAVAKARELLEAYDLTMESIADLKADPRTSVRHGTAVARATEGKPEGWKTDLLDSVAQTFDCYTAYEWIGEPTPSGRTRSVKVGHLIGFGHDVEMAGYAHAFLVAEIERLAQAYADVMWAEIGRVAKELDIPHHQAESYYVRDTGRHPLKAKLYFTQGAAEAVRNKLWHQHRDRDRARHDDPNQNPYALVLDKRRTVEDFIYMERYGKTKAEYDAEVMARMEEYRAKNQFAHREMAPEERARREREFRRYQEAESRRIEREEAAKDHHAIRAGSDAGSRIEIHPGIRQGTRPKEVR